MPRPAIITALVAALMLTAIPFYLWRRPRMPDQAVAPIPPRELARPSRPAAAPVATVERRPRVKVSHFTTIRCVKRGPGRTPPDECEHVGEVERALTKTLHDTFAYGPKTITGATVSVVLDIDFRKRRLEIYRGKSSTVPRSRTRALFDEIRKVMPEPRWNELTHRHDKYVVYVKATYPPRETF